MIVICLSTYNGERFLREQLDSILAQTYTNWCLYVRDDGSKDATMDILKEYAQKDKRIHVVSDHQNIGAKHSFMRLVEQCEQADYYAFADQDDVWDADKMEIALQTMQAAEVQYPDRPIVVHTDLRVVDANLQPIASSFWQYSHIRPELLDSNIHYLALCNSVTGCAMLFNQAARACSLPMPEDAYMHDLWIAQRTMLAGGQIIPIFKTPIAYRQHGKNVIGASEYSVMRRSWKQRRQTTQLVYTISHPHIFANKWQFWWWKMIYICHRILKPNKHG